MYKYFLQFLLKKMKQTPQYGSGRLAGRAGSSWIFYSRRFSLTATFGCKNPTWSGPADRSRTVVFASFFLTKNGEIFVHWIFLIF